MASVAVITGTGFYDILTSCSQEIHISSAFSKHSVHLLQNEDEITPVFLLARHGKDHSVAPHKINYRANIDALSQLGIDYIIAINVVGVINQKNVFTQLKIGDVIVPDQIIDYTYGREHTFFDKDFNPHQHIDFEMPLDEGLRKKLIHSVKCINGEVISTATYGCTQGPRLETSAEINRMKMDGCDVVGMTMMPEAALAMEKGIAYASLCVCVNWASGVSDEKLNIEKIQKILTEMKPKLTQMIKKTINTLNESNKKQ